MKFGFFSTYLRFSEGCQSCTLLWIRLLSCMLVLRWRHWLHFTMEGGTASRHRRWSCVLQALKNQFRQVLLLDFSSFEWTSQHSTPLTVQAAREDTPDETVALFFPSQISLG